MSIALSTFARERLFGASPRILGVTDGEFVAELNRRTPARVLDGYAPFCKLHVHPNWTTTVCGSIEITPANQHLLRSGYEARTAGELPVLVRWFDGIEPPGPTGCS